MNTNTQKVSQAVFLATGENITEQYLEVLSYCKEKNLPIVNIFISQDVKDEQKLYQIINEALDFATVDGVKNKKRTAIVVASKENLSAFMTMQDISNLIIDDMIELHIACSKTRFSKQ